MANVDSRRESSFLERTSKNFLQPFCRRKQNLNMSRRRTLRFARSSGGADAAHASAGTWHIKEEICLVQIDACVWFSQNAKGNSRRARRPSSRRHKRKLR